MSEWSNGFLGRPEFHVVPVVAPKPIVFHGDVTPRMVHWAKDGRMLTVIGEVRRHAAQWGIQENEMETALSNGYLQSHLFQLSRKLVYFHQPDEDTVTRQVHGSVIKLIPRTWWDHWKFEHPRLRRLFGPIEWDEVITEYAEYITRQQFHERGYIGQGS